MKFNALFPRPYILAAAFATSAVTSAASANSTRELMDAVEALSRPSTETSFRYALYDLNGDGISDAVVILQGRRWCGSGGCTMLVLRGMDRGFSLVSKVTISNEPVMVASAIVHGWHTLLVSVRGGGSHPAMARMTFDGNRYLLNPSVQPSANSSDLANAVRLTFVGADRER